MKEMIVGGLKTAALVGTILLVINQYDALFGDQPFNWLKAILTYCVPFIVFNYGLIKGKRKSN